jgi:2-polyprenylphenol hydroxylase and related flavodoxin oxidoreductases
LRILKIENVERAQAIVVGPPIMMKFTIQELLKKGIREENLWVSYERKMCCGIGKCGHCRMNDTYICLDGPVFNYTKAKHLVD